MNRLCPVCRSARLSGKQRKRVARRVGRRSIGLHGKTIKASSGLCARADENRRQRKRLRSGRAPTAMD